MNTASNSLYPTKDDHWVLIEANNDAIFKRLTRIMRHPEWGTDVRYVTHRSRGERVDEVDGLVTVWTLERNANEVQKLLVEAEVPVSRVSTIADIFEDRHYQALEMLLRIPHPSLGTVTMTGVVTKMSRTPGKIVKAGPGLGQDTRDVLANDLGLDEAEIDLMIGAGVVWCARAMTEPSNLDTSKAAAV